MSRKPRLVELFAFSRPSFGGDKLRRGAENYLRWQTKVITANLRSGYPRLQDLLAASIAFDLPNEFFAGATPFERFEELTWAQVNWGAQTVAGSPVAEHTMQLLTAWRKLVVDTEQQQKLMPQPCLWIKTNVLGHFRIDELALQLIGTKRVRQLGKEAPYALRMRVSSVASAWETLVNVRLSLQEADYRLMQRAAQQAEHAARLQRIQQEEAERAKRKAKTAELKAQKLAKKLEGAAPIGVRPARPVKPPSLTKQHISEPPKPNRERRVIPPSLIKQRLTNPAAASALPPVADYVRRAPPKIIEFRPRSRIDVDSTTPTDFLCSACRQTLDLSELAYITKRGYEICTECETFGWWGMERPSDKRRRHIPDLSGMKLSGRILA